MSKVDRYISKEFNSILKDSREYRAYELGFASGYYKLYEYIKIVNDVETAKEFFKEFTEGEDRVGEYFRKLVELDEKINSEKDDFLDKLDKYDATKDKEFNNG